MHRTYDVAGELFGVRTTSPAFGEWLDRTFSAYAVDRKPRANDYYYSVDLPDPSGPGLGRRFATLYVSGGISVRTFSLPVLAEAMISEFANWEHINSPDGVYLDAGVARVGDASILVKRRIMKWLGEHQLRAQRSGVVLSAELTVSLDPETLEVTRLPRPNVPADAIETLAPLVADEGLADGSVDRFMLDEPTRLAAVVDADWLDGTLREISPAEMTREYAVSAPNMRASGGQILLPIASLMQSVPCFTVSSVRPQLAFDALNQIANGQLAAAEA